MSQLIQLRTALARVLSLQDAHPHPAWPAVAVDWDAPHDALHVTAIVNGARMLLPWAQVATVVEQRNAMVQRSKAEPLKYGYEPPAWREIDIQVARKRLFHPGVPLDVLIMGGIRSGKTEFAAKRMVCHYCYTPDAWVWGLHETEDTSKTIQQPRVLRFLPSELNSDSGKFKKDKFTKFNYSEGGGFTGNKFVVYWQARDEAGAEFRGGGLFDFQFYKSKDSTLQGAELTAATSDELVPKVTVATVRERLLSRAADTKSPEYVARVERALELLAAGEEIPRVCMAALYHGVHIITFTPKEGYSPTVADFLDGAIITHEVPAELLPGKRVPRFKQPKDSSRLVAYMHTYDNVFKGNWPAMVTLLRGRKEDEIKITAYGDVGKNWKTNFSFWRDTAHIVTRFQIPRKGSWYEFTDYATARPWFTLWVLVCPLGRRYVVREWPQEGDDIPDAGDPGAWAVSSECGKRNGDAGPAQENTVLCSYGFSDYKRERLRIRAELGAWWDPAKPQLAWREFALLPVPIEDSYGDGRLGTSPTPREGGTTTIIESLNEIEIDDKPWPGNALSEGDTFIKGALKYDDSKEVDALNTPKLFVLQDCLATIFMFQNYSTPPFSENTRASDEACKEPRDCLAAAFLSGADYVGGAGSEGWGGGSY